MSPLSRIGSATFALASLTALSHAQTWETCAPLHTFNGTTPGAQFGWVGVNGGDVDGDGVDDVLFGTPFDAGGRGRIELHSGATGTFIRGMDGPVAGDGLGYMVGPAGDVNADGRDDVIVGAPRQNGTGPGQAFVLSGVDGSVLLPLTGEVNGDQFGKSVWAAGDVNADGHDDVLVGAPQNDEAANNAGKVYLVSGADGSVLDSWTGASNGDNLGSAVAGIGDRDGDGHDDFILGASGAGVARTGEVYVVGGADGLVDCTLTPRASAVSFGLYFLGPVGDVDADGTGDFFVCDFSDTTSGGGTGRAYVYSGADCSELYSWAGDRAGDGFGIGRGWVGDVDHDGHDDVLVGHWTSNLGGPSAGRLSIFSGADGSLLQRYTGETASDTLGFDCAGMGDVNGDGEMDVLGTAPGRSQNLGIAWILSGSPNPPRSVCATTPNSAGDGAVMDYRRSLSIATNDFRVRVEGCVPNATAVFFYGQTATSRPLGNGELCVGGRLFRVGAPTTINAAGNRSMPLDFTAAPLAAGPGAVTPGSTWVFSCWYRDVAAGGALYDFADGMRVTFCP